VLHYLTRTTNKGHTRYYKIISLINLFGDHIVQRIFGSVSYKKPTGMIEHSFHTRAEAERYVKAILSRKIHRGYSLCVL